LTVLEGLASGIAVLATAVGGNPEMIEHNVNGWLVKSGDQEELSAGLVALLTHQDLRSRLAAAARPDAIARYSIPRYLTEICSLYRAILSSRKVSQQKNLPNLKLKPSSD